MRMNEIDMLVNTSFSSVNTFQPDRGSAGPNIYCDRWPRMTDSSKSSIKRRKSALFIYVFFFVA